VSDADDEPCLACRNEPPVRERTVVWGEYDGVLRKAILALKHHGRDELAAGLGLRLAGRIAAEPWASSIDCVTFVPSHRVWVMRRGYTAAQMLARTVGRALACPFTKLLRRRGLRRQVHQSHTQRLGLSSQSFATTRPTRQLVLLIDDVVTTGTTLERAARALLDAGAPSVYCAALAATPQTRKVL